MYKLPKTALPRWNQHSIFSPGIIDAPCPYCRRNLVTFSTQSWQNHVHFWSASSECPACHKESHFWLIIREKVNDPDSAREKTDVYMDPDPIWDQEYDKRIDQVSPRFALIYRQTVRAEMLGLDALVGIGYRKAIEFLLKDWAISDHPDEKDVIAKMHLGDCIQKYIPDPVLRDGFARVVWLGNDETHYQRKWDDKDIDDLKRLLHASLNKMACDLELKSLAETMPPKK